MTGIPLLVLQTGMNEKHCMHCKSGISGHVAIYDPARIIYKWYLQQSWPAWKFRRIRLESYATPPLHQIRQNQAGGTGPSPFPWSSPAWLTWHISKSCCILIFTGQLAKSLCWQEFSISWCYRLRHLTDKWIGRNILQVESQSEWNNPKHWKAKHFIPFQRWEVAPLSNISNLICQV